MILTADDFGISPAVDLAILQLIEKGKISSTSCMVTASNPELRNDLASLKEFRQKIDIGLHLVLTDAFSLKTLIAQAYLHRLSPTDIENKIRRQIEIFVDYFGQLPDFIDGHQHVQQLPVVRDALISAVKSFGSIKYIRVADLPNQWLWNSAQSFLFDVTLGNIALLIPGRQSAIVFAKHGIKHNRYLLGYYRHNPAIQFKKVFENYLALKPGADDIFFCHPGYIDEHLKNVDTLVESRKDNLNFLMSAEFEDMCKINQIGINKYTSDI